MRRLIEYKVSGVSVVFFLLFAWFNVNHATASTRIQVTPLDRTIASTGRGIVTLRFNLTNTSRRAESLYEKLDLPPSWNLITQPTPFLLAAGAQETHLLHIIVPATAQAVSHRIQYQVFDQKTGNILADESVYVVVKAIAGISLKRVTPPLSLLAGESYSVGFVLTNTGNIAENYSIDVDDHNGFMTSLNAAKVKLSPNESHSINVKGNIPDLIDAGIQHVLVLRVRSSGKTQFEKIHIPLIARETDGVGQYHELYGELRTGISAQFNTNEEGTKNSANMVTSYVTRGNLDKAGEHKIELQLRKGHDFDQPFDASPEHYRLAYKHKESEIVAGHQLFSGSQLSGQSLAGIGGRVRHSINRGEMPPIKLEAFAGTSKPESEQNHKVMGGSLGYRFDEQGIDVQANIIHAESDDTSTTIPSLEMSWSGDSANANFELAHDGSQQAHRLETNAQWGKLSGSLNYRMGDSDFKGSYADKRQWYSGVNWQIDDDTRLTLTHRNTEDNLAGDSSKSIKHAQENRLSISRRLGEFNNTTAKLGYGVKTQIDQRDISSMDEETQSASIALQHAWDKLNISAQWEQGKRIDHLTHTESEGSRKSVGVNWKPDEAWHINGSYSHSEGLDESVSQSLGVQAKHRINARKNISINARHNRSDSKDSQSDALSLVYSQKLAKQRRLEVQFNHTRAELDGEALSEDSQIRLDFVMPLDIPFKPRDDIATVCGQTLMGGVPVSNIVLLLNEHYAVSDANGRFCYRNILAKSYVLQVDNSRQTSEGSANYIMQGYGQRRDIDLKAGSTKEIAVNLSRGAQIMGQLVKMSVNKAHEGIGGALIYIEPMNDIRNERRPAQRTTDASGYFNFSGLSEGRWKVRLDGKTKLPQHYKVRQSTFVVNLQRGQREKVVIEVMPKIQGIEKVGPSGGFSVSG